MKTLLREMLEKLLVDLTQVDQKMFGRFEQILKRSEKAIVEMDDSNI